jgi:hypothetical protein
LDDGGSRPIETTIGGSTRPNQLFANGHTRRRDRCRFAGVTDERRFDAEEPLTVQESLRLHSPSILVACAAFLFASCSYYDIAAYQNAAVRARDRSYEVYPGQQTILEYCHERSLPIPDAASGFCLYLPLRNGSLAAGAAVHFDPEYRPAYLWQLHAPGRSITSNIDVDVKVVSVTNGGVRVFIRGKTRSSEASQWRYRGEEFYPFRTIPPPNRGNTF